VPKGHLQHLPSQLQRREGRHQGAQKLDHLKSQIGQSGFPESGQHVCSRELIQQAIQDSIMVKLRRSGSSLVGLPSSALLLGQATNTWAVGASVNDVSTLSTLGGVVRTMRSAVDALPPGMVRTS
jgi:hypothetical protein